ncbi:immunoglobulin superfamily member 11 isoform X2 [Sphaeramia orbicularis]|uniref:immunoglobulin superfamily member 11 isoform X2 n=1 Tax=Sphaeramia orbicularis TaxID=375764 RepID=UPI00118011DA|nr:immunoglobulin superfamily member 11 isoform X2 [Sphaeramia orbicularis]
MVKFHNSDLWIAWMVIFCMEGSRFDPHTGRVCVQALDVTVSQSSIQVARGQAAILPCSFTTSAALTNLNIIWMVIPLSNANQPEQVIIYQGGQVFSLANHLNGRVGFVATMPSTSASIFINNTQLSDTGTYQCLVNNLPDRGGRNIGVIGLTVLVPPSVPACRIQGTLDVGSDIMLICSSEEGIPTPSYSWEKLDALPKLPHNAMQGIKHKLAVGVPFCPTFADQMQGTVTLRNISTSTSGLYQCTSSNAIGKSTCLLNLQVVAPQPQSVGLIAGTIATGVLAVIICSLLVVVTLFYWKNKNKYDEEEIPNEIREDDLPPKRSSSVKAFHADASSSENDTLTSTNTYNSRYWHNPKPNYDTNSYTRYNGDTRQTFSAAAHGAHGHGQAQNTAHSHSSVVTAPGSAPLSRHAQPTAPTPTAFANGSHTLPPPKTLVVTTNSAPSPPTMVRSNGSVSLKPVVTSTHGQHTHSYAVSQATLERMGAVPVMVPAQSRAGSLV